MGVSKIVRGIEGKVGDKWDWERGELGNGNGLSGVRGLVNWGVFGKWMGMGEFGWWSVMGVSWGVGDDWFVGKLMIDWCLICWITNTLSAGNDGLKVGNIPVYKYGI